MLCEQAAATEPSLGPALPHNSLLTPEVDSLICPCHCPGDVAADLVCCQDLPRHYVVVECAETQGPVLSCLPCVFAQPPHTVLKGLLGQEQTAWARSRGRYRVSRSHNAGGDGNNLWHRLCTACITPREVSPRSAPYNCWFAFCAHKTTAAVEVPG